MNEDDKLFYGQYAIKMQECQNIMQLEINSIIKRLTTDPELKPVEHLSTRIKNPESLIEKLKFQGRNQTVETGLTELSDLIGFRIVTLFINDIYVILEEIKKSDKWKVDTVKDYIKNPKPNGYRSLHILLEMPFGVNGIDTILTEIQIRTISMDCWAALEHQLKYKKHIDDVELMTNELKRCADEMQSTSMTMQAIKDTLESV